MSFNALQGDFNRLLRQLPFDLNDSRAVGKLLKSYLQEGKPHQRETLELWAYCFIYTYYTNKYVQDKQLLPSDVETLVTKAFDKVRNRWDSIREPERITAWLGTLCRNQYISYMRKHVPLSSLPESYTQQPEELTLPEREPHSLFDLDKPLLYQATLRAIERLPAYLQEVTRYHFLDSMSYAEIAEQLGKPVANIRAYIHKALKTLHKDPELSVLIQEYQEAQK